MKPNSLNSIVAPCGSGKSSALLLLVRAQIETKRDLTTRGQ